MPRRNLRVRLNLSRLDASDANLARAGGNRTAQTRLVRIDQPAWSNPTPRPGRRPRPDP
ncbi:hypothetical protein [Urbifossiella limnaea]|uniref:hypothetical protein n=1 Tax=Urbifossiella limnaea TaxID=2528023 RepID=UPI00192E3A4B|nr:hypothetical protein [Urbifossiella limnaea]